MKLLKTLTFILTLALAACADQSSRSIESQLEAAGLGIQGGELVSESADPVTAKVKSVLAILHQKGFKPHCGGVHIAPRLVLTAAHCLFDDDTKTWIPVKDLKISTCIDNKSEGCNWSQVKSFIVHEDYYLQNEENVKNREKYSAPIPASFNDVAIVLIDNPAKTRVFVPTSPMSPAANDELFAFGVGKIQRDASLDRMMRTVKLSADLASNHMQDPKDAVGRYLAIHTSEKGICPGDSGGPIFIVKDGSILLSGLALMNLSGAQKSACRVWASVILDLSQYSDWIKNKSEQLLGKVRTGQKRN